MCLARRGQDRVAHARPVHRVVRALTALVFATQPAGAHVVGSPQQVRRDSGQELTIGHFFRHYDRRASSEPPDRRSIPARRTRESSLHWWDPRSFSYHGSSRLRIAIGSDHAGFRLKGHFIDVLKSGGHDVTDLGTDSEEPVDYPPICAGVGKEVAAGRVDRGIVLGGSGQGEQISANKVRGVRAALCNDLYTAEYSRRHNDANVLSIGARIVAEGLADEILDTWLTTGFEGGRHQRRVDEITELEGEQ